MRYFIPVRQHFLFVSCDIFSLYLKKRQLYKLNLVINHTAFSVSSRVRHDNPRLCLGVLFKLANVATTSASAASRSSPCIHRRVCFYETNNPPKGTLGHNNTEPCPTENSTVAPPAVKSQQPEWLSLERGDQKLKLASSPFTPPSRDHRDGIIFDSSHQIQQKWGM